MSNPNNHNKYLGWLLKNLNREFAKFSDLPQLDFILREPTWHDLNGNPKSLCDAIVGQNNSDLIPVELKQSVLKREKAIRQLYQGRKFIQDELLRECSNIGVFVCYNPRIPPEMNAFSYEIIEI